MTSGDEKRSLLLRAAVKARADQFALNLVISLGLLSSADAPTPEQEEKIVAANSACIAADEALSKYEEDQRSTGQRPSR